MAGTEIENLELTENNVIGSPSVSVLRHPASDRADPGYPMHNDFVGVSWERIQTNGLHANRTLVLEL